MVRTPRSLKVHPEKIDRVKEAFIRCGCFNQTDLASELQLHPDTVSKFLNGHRVSIANAHELCRRLNLDSDEFLVLGSFGVTTMELDPRPTIEIQTIPKGEELTTVPLVIDAECTDVEATAEKPITKITARIEQDIDTIEGLAVGHAEKINVLPQQITAKSVIDINSVEAQPLREKPLKDIEVKQTVNKVALSGVLIGGANRIAIEKEG